VVETAKSDRKRSCSSWFCSCFRVVEGGGEVAADDSPAVPNRSGSTPSRVRHSRAVHT
jgi:hypothetical protein